MSQTCGLTPVSLTRCVFIWRLQPPKLLKRSPQISQLRLKCLLVWCNSKLSVSSSHSSQGIRIVAMQGMSFSCKLETFWTCLPMITASVCSWKCSVNDSTVINLSRHRLHSSTLVWVGVLRISIALVGLPGFLHAEKNNDNKNKYQKWIANFCGVMNKEISCLIAESTQLCYMDAILGPIGSSPKWWTK